VVAVLVVAVLAAAVAVSAAAGLPAAGKHFINVSCMLQERLQISF